MYINVHVYFAHSPFFEVSSTLSPPLPSAGIGRLQLLNPDRRKTKRVVKEGGKRGSLPI